MKNTIGIVNNIKKKITLQKGIDEFSLAKKSIDKLIKIQKTIKMEIVNIIKANFFTILI